MEIRERIIETAGGLYEKYGIRSVTMNDIANALSISKKTIYQYFKDKDEIVATCTSFLLNAREKEIEERLTAEQDAIGRFLIISEHMKRHIRSMNPSLLFDLERYHPKAWLLYLEHRNTCMLQNLMVTMQAGIDQGVFRQDINVAILAKMRVEQIQLGFDQQLFPSKAFDLSEVQIQFFNHFLRGLCTSKGLKQIENHEENQQNPIQHEVGKSPQ